MAAFVLPITGKHSNAANNSLGRQYVNASPELTLTGMDAFTVLGGGSVSSFDVTSQKNNALAAGDVIVCKPSGSNTCVIAQITGMSKATTNPGTLVTPTSGEWSGQTGEFTLGTGTVYYSTGDSGFVHSNSYSGGILFEAVVSQISANHTTIGLYDASKSNTANGEWGSMDSMGSGYSFFVTINATQCLIRCGSSTVIATLTESCEGRRITLTRYNGVVKFWIDGVVKYTFTPTFTEPMRCHFGGYDTVKFDSVKIFHSCTTESYLYTYTLTNCKGSDGAALAAVPESVFKAHKSTALTVDGSSTTSSMVLTSATSGLIASGAGAYLSGKLTTLGSVVETRGSETQVDHGTSWDTGGVTGYTMVDRSNAIPAGRAVTKIRTSQNSAQTMKIKIVRRTAASTFDVVYDQQVSHSGGGVQEFTLTTPYTIPNDGYSYYAAIYFPGAVMYSSGNAGSYSTGDKTGSGQTINDSTNACYINYKYVTVFTYTCTSMSPALGSVPAVAAKVIDPVTFMLAAGITDEALVKETSLVLSTGASTTQAVIDGAAASTLYKSGGRHNKLLLTVNGSVVEATATGATNNTTSNVVTSTSSSQWNGSTSGFNFGSGTIAYNSSIGAPAIKSVATFTGDFDFMWTPDSSDEYINIGVFPVSEDAAFNATDNYGGMYEMTNSYYIRHYEGGVFTPRKGTASYTAVSGSQGQAMRISRRNGVLRWYKAGVLVHTWSTTNTSEMRLCICGYSNKPNLSAVGWDASPNTTTVTFSAVAATPTAASIKTRFDLPVSGLQSITYAAGPKLVCKGVRTTLPDESTLKRIAMRVATHTASFLLGESGRLENQERP